MSENVEKISMRQVIIGGCTRINVFLIGWLDTYWFMYVPLLREKLCRILIAFGCLWVAVEWFQENGKIFCWND